MINDVIDIYLVDRTRLHRKKSMQSRDRVEIRIIKSRLVRVVSRRFSDSSQSRDFSQNQLQISRISDVAWRFGPEVNRRYREYNSRIFKSRDKNDGNDQRVDET